MQVIDDHGITRFTGDVFSASVAFWTKEGKGGAPDTQIPFIRIRENKDNEEMVAEIQNLTGNAYIKFSKFYVYNQPGLSIAQLPIFSKLVEFVMYEIYKNPELISLDKNWHFKS